ncbi:MAG: hypothetical protein BroJett040_11050 [Oligoflexia bacterium]|nr:MAG: hypothetical protein BroJett040_11050 [Oligoflexia bacterium]
MKLKSGSKKFKLGIIGLTSLFSWQTFGAQIRCESVLQSRPGVYEYQKGLIEAYRSRVYLKDQTPQVTTAYGSKREILRSFEKEGLHYEDIAEWFPDVKPGSRAKLNEIFEKEKYSKQSRMMKWLANAELNPLAPVAMRAHWSKMSPEQRWAFLRDQRDFFLLLMLKSRSEIFSTRLLTFDDIIVGDNVPKDVIVGDDIGSYEVRLSKAISNRTDFHAIRDNVEKFLDGKIGHQHLFHGWPEASGVRKHIAPYYIELLDSTTWFLYWRQMNRNPEDTKSLLTHPYLGVYSTNSLGRLHQAMEQGNPKAFNDKFRMVGARTFAPREGDIYGDWIPDWELRSGNKGVRREFVESMIESRLVTGDYSGLRDFRNYEFNTLATIQELTSGKLSASEVRSIEEFEKLHPKMEYSTHKLARNHYRTRIISPLLPWADRINIDFKKDVLNQAQLVYAKGLAKVAKSYLKKINEKGLNNVEKGEINSKAIDKLEVLMYEFAKVVRLDLDFERYLKPTAEKVPEVQVVQYGPFKVNDIGLGIEYSFRFPLELRPKEKLQAEGLIGSFAEKLAKQYGTERVEEMTDPQGDSHGHGMVVKYKVKDKDKETWRVEWDGIAREYVDGQVARAWGGHIEVVSPKFAPQKMEGPVMDLYAAGKKNGLAPSRAAGGAHVNFDLGYLKKNFSTEQGTRALINLVQLFESEKEVILRLWQHPKRKHAAYPVNFTTEMAQKLENFKGDWTDLGRQLYEMRYFNTNIGRKPKYVPINLTALMTDILPVEYLDKSLDIKNPTHEWFPNFNRVYDRGEARFFDAPTDEKMAALQIKYWRALMNKAFNAGQVLKYQSKYSSKDLQEWKEDAGSWKKAVESHLVELGLDPAEFQSLIWDSFMIHNTVEPRQVDYQEFTNFKPAK